MAAQAPSTAAKGTGGGDGPLSPPAKGTEKMPMTPRDVAMTSEYRSAAANMKNDKLRYLLMAELVTAADVQQKDYAQALNVSPSTISRYVKDKSSGKVGRPGYFKDPSCREYIKNKALEGSRNNKAWTYKNVSKAASVLKLQREGGNFVHPPKPQWAYDLLAEIASLETPTVLDEERHEASTRGNLQDFQNEVDANMPCPMDEVHPELIFDIDEVSGSVSKKGKQCKAFVEIIGRKDKDNPTKRPTVKGEKKSKWLTAYHITLLLCVSACGGHQEKPLCILPETALTVDDRDAHGDDFVWAGTPKGWVTDEVYESYIIDHFIPHVKARRGHCKEKYGNAYNEVAVLFSDGHGSRWSVKAQQALEEAKIKLIVLPAHTSHILAPLDAHVNERLKKGLRALRDSGEIKLDGGVHEYRSSMLSAMKTSLHDAFNPYWVQKSFRVTGIWPWNIGKVAEDSTKVEQTDQKPRRRKGKAAQLGGKIVNSAMMIKYENDQVLTKVIKAWREVTQKQKKVNARLEARAERERVQADEKKRKTEEREKRRREKQEEKKKLVDEREEKRREKQREKERQDAEKVRVAQERMAAKARKAGKDTTTKAATKAKNGGKKSGPGKRRAGASVEGSPRTKKPTPPPRKRPTGLRQQPKKNRKGNEVTSVLGQKRVRDPPRDRSISKKPPREQNKENNDNTSTV